MFYRMLAKFTKRYTSWVIAAWICVLAASVPFAAKLPSVLKDHGLRAEGSYARVQQILESDFGIPDDPVILLFEKKEQVTEAQFRRFIAQTSSRVKEADGLQQLISPLDNKAMMNGNYAYALLSFRQHAHEMKPVIGELQRLLPRDSQMTVKMTGKPVVQEDVNRISQNDLKKAETVGIPIAFLILWLSFGGAVSAMIPVLVGLVGVGGAMAIMYGLGTKLDLSVFVLNVIPMVGLALSIDFALLMVSRFREEFREHPLDQALVTTMRTAGRAVVFSALCVFLGLAGTLFIRLPIFRTVALGAMVVLALSVMAALTLVPALLTVLGEWIGSEKNGRRATAGRTSRWHVLAAAVMKRPIRTCLIVSAVLATCFWPLVRLKVAIPDASSLPAAIESRQAAELLNRHFGYARASQVYIVAEGNGPVLQKNDWVAAFGLIRQLERDPSVDRVDSVFSVLPVSPERMEALFRDPGLRERHATVLRPFVHGNRMLISVTLREGTSSEQAMDWIRNQRRAVGDLRLLYGGEPKYEQEVFDEIYGNIPRSLLFIFVSNFMILFAAFRSLLIPVKTIAMNLIGIAASFGIMAWVFQEGRFGVEPTEIAVMIPVFIFGLVFGISMDYGVFLLSRIYEVHRKTGDNDFAVREGLALTGKLITSAAAIMIAVTAPFAWGGVAGVKQLGVGIAAAVFIDASLVRTLLVPSLMKLLGRWNWWAP